jgi:hypothetical protein
LYADLLSVPRTLDGGDPGTPPGDRLFFDAKGQPVTDAGIEFSAPGFGLVTHEDFETEQTTNFPALSVDNSDPSPSYEDTGFTFLVPPLDTHAYKDYISVTPADSGNQATWTFQNVPSGVYLVSASWNGVEDQNRADDAHGATHGRLDRPGSFYGRRRHSD